MRLRKNTQDVAQPIFCQNEYVAGIAEKRSQKFCASSAMFKALPKVNNRPIWSPWTKQLCQNTVTQQLCQNTLTR
jgi:hypothetical protein